MPVPAPSPPLAAAAAEGERGRLVAAALPRPPPPLPLPSLVSAEEEAAAVERSVEGVLAEGYRTPDIAGVGGEVVGTAQMGDVIAGRV